MRSRKSWIVLTLISAIVLVACVPVVDDFSGDQIGPAKPIEYNLLSGIEGANNPILVVKIDDTRQAHPQIGVESADIVYVEQVEGGLTRLAAVFSSTIPALIGPVRSARITDIELLAQFGHVAFAYSGAQGKLLPIIRAANLQDLGAQSQPPIIYIRDPARSAPVDLVLRADLLMAKTISQKMIIALPKPLGWIFGETPVGGREIDSVKVRWPANSYTATWSKEQGRWLLSNSQRPDISASGKQLGPTTFVIQIVSIVDSIYHDRLGGATPLSITVGSGSGYILRDGKVFQASWNRVSPSSGTTWLLADGSQMRFAPGQIWVALSDSAPEFSFTPTPSPSASSSPTK